MGTFTVRSDGDVEPEDVGIVIEGIRVMDNLGSPWSSTIQTTIHHPDQTPLQSSVTVHRRPPGPIRSHHRGPGPPPVPNANMKQGPPPAPRSAHMTQNLPHWIQHRNPQTAIHGVATEALDLRDTCCGILDKL
ncbi:unnamed protein product [Pleuronectes platessa]|uniref:Uncharacterized protein n=1 Tax=Pleuronectes platessa TaxID=8262 RepID=A0A9N7UTB7_PLEPL|nr:unnamed protein product [Pleuronectes platessa]